MTSKKRRPRGGNPEAVHTDSPDTHHPSTSRAAVEPLLTTEDLMELLRASRSTIERLRHRGMLPRPDLTLGRMPRWRAQTIRRWLEEGGGK